MQKSAIIIKLLKYTKSDFGKKLSFKTQVVNVFLETFLFLMLLEEKKKLLKHIFIIYIVSKQAILIY